MKILDLVYIYIYNIYIIMFEKCETYADKYYKNIQKYGGCGENIKQILQKKNPNEIHQMMNETGQYEILKKKKKYCVKSFLNNKNDFNINCVTSNNNSDTYESSYEEENGEGIPICNRDVTVGIQIINFYH